MKYCYLIIIFLITACEQKNTLKSEPGNASTEYKSNDTIPQFRKEVSKKAVASYIIPYGDPALKQKFGVNIYETPKTFQYLLDMHYGSMNVTDTLKLPNFGTWPVIQVKPGEEKLTCIIGFLDKKKEFKEYKMLTAKSNKLRLIVLKRYSVGYYSDTYKQP